MRNALSGSIAFSRSVVVDTTKSPHAKLQPIPISSVKLNDQFWSPRLKTLQEVTLLTQYDLMEETGRIDNFRRASGKINGEFRGAYYNDSDVYKWLEASAWSLAFRPNEKISELMEVIISEISAAQDESGYLNTYFVFDRKKDRWTNLRDMHELYCAGHLIQAAIAHHRVTNDETFLQVAIRFANHIAEVFGQGKKEQPDGHPEIEMALVELYRETTSHQYLQMAQFFLNARGYKLIGGSPYHQDHKPFYELDEVTGHAVRAVYLNAGASDVYAETGDQRLMDSLQRQWINLTQKRMYVTGGCGSRHEGEAFGEDYELPNESAYAETCAAIANILWNWRMLLLTGESKFADVLELSLFNGALAGIGLDGKSYFYVNPLSDRGKHRRRPYFECACCPPNIARLLAMVPQFIYTTDTKDIWVHIYANSTAHIPLHNTTITVMQRTNYPWDGEVEFIVQLPHPINFTIHMRLPNWCQKAFVQVNGKTIDSVITNGYLLVRKEWKAGDVVHLSMTIQPELLISHPFVKSNNGCVAIRRGPIIYCLEQVDNPSVDVWEIAIKSETNFRLERGNFPPLQGMIIIRGEGVTVDPKVWDDKLYLPLNLEQKHFKPVSFTAIPYFAWANRQSGPMSIWLPYRPCICSDY